MPIYEFYCPDNHKLYSFYARSTQFADCVPRCPDDPSYGMIRQVSSFAITQGESDAEDGGEDFLDAVDERALHELEQAVGNLDSEDADPRQLTELMGRFSEMTGKRLPEPFKEMMAKLEAGEDPQALEEAYADLLNDEALLEEVRRELSHNTSKPERDDTLYELTDYIDA